MDNRLAMSQHHVLVAKKANSMFGCIKKTIVSRSRDVILPFYSAPVRTHLEYFVQFWALPLRKRQGSSIRTPVEATKMTKILEHLPYKERLRELCVFSLEKMRLRVGLVNVYKYVRVLC